MYGCVCLLMWHFTNKNRFHEYLCNLSHTEPVPKCRVDYLTTNSEHNRCVRTGSLVSVSNMSHCFSDTFEKCILCEYYHCTARFNVKNWSSRAIILCTSPPSIKPKEILQPRSAFLKLWSADRKWSSGSALVVLLDWTLVQKREKK